MARPTYQDTDDAPGGGEAPNRGGWQIAQDIPIEKVDRSSKPDHPMTDVMHTPSMSSPAATRPRKSTAAVLNELNDLGNEPRLD